MDMPTDSGDAVRQNNSSIPVLRRRMRTMDRLTAAVTFTEEAAVIDRTKTPVVAVTVTEEAAVIDRTKTPVAAVSHGTLFKKI